MKKLAILPNAPSTPESLEQYQDMFADLLRGVGRERFAKGVDRCCRREHSRDVEGVTRAFYPQYDELKRLIPPPPSGKPDPNCKLCHGEGHYYVRHCDCRKQNKTDTGLDGDADPRCIVCHGVGFLIDDDRKRNTRVKFCTCKSRPA